MLQVMGVLGSVFDAADRLVERTAAVVEAATRRGPPAPYSAPPDWEERLHRVLGAPWPCGAVGEFSALWERILGELRLRGMRVGRGSYAGFDDADPGLARALWCIVHHLGARCLVETGVARGLTTRVLLEGLERRQRGELWSIDLAPFSVPSEVRGSEVGAAVPPERKARWHLLEGASRRLLGPLLRRLGAVDLFVHDSLHSTRNVRFELRRAWGALRPGGCMVCDDIDLSRGLQRFREGLRESAEVIVCGSDDGRRLFAVVRKPP